MAHGPSAGRDGQTSWNDPARGYPAGGRPAGEGRSQPGRHRAGAHHAPGVSGTWLARIHTERMDAWANSRPGERSRLAAAVLPRLLEEAGAPDGALPTLSWLLGHADLGLRLTARHYIPPALVTEAVDMFGWREQLAGALRQELDVFPLHTLRGLAQGEMGAIRRSGTSLVLSRTGRLMTEDPEARWRIGTAALVGADDGARPDFAVAVREAGLLFLLVSGPAGDEELTRHLTRIHTEEGWTSHGGVSEAVRQEIRGLRHRLWALHLLYTGRASREPLTLTETGRGGGAGRAAGPGSRAPAPRRPRVSPAQDRSGTMRAWPSASVLRSSQGTGREFPSPWARRVCSSCCALRAHGCAGPAHVRSIRSRGRFLMVRSPPLTDDGVRDADFIQSLERGLSVIRAFGAEHPKLSLSEVAVADWPSRGRPPGVSCTRWWTSVTCAWKT